MGDVTVVTGGTGFVGAAVIRHLVAAGHRIRALVRPGSDRRLLAGLPLEIVDWDLMEAASLRQVLTGCLTLFHVAAFYKLWARDRRQFAWRRDIQRQPSQRRLRSGGDELCAVVQRFPR